MRSNPIPNASYLTVMGHHQKAIADGADLLLDAAGYVRDFIVIDYRAGKTYFISSHAIDGKSYDGPEQDRPVGIDYYPKESNPNLTGLASIIEEGHKHFRGLGGKVGGFLDMKALPEELRQAIVLYEAKAAEYRGLVVAYSGGDAKKHGNYHLIPAPVFERFTGEFMEAQVDLHKQFAALDEIPIQVGTAAKKLIVANEKALEPRLMHSNLGIVLYAMKRTSKGAADRNYYHQGEDDILGANFQQTIISDTLTSAMKYLIQNGLTADELPTLKLEQVGAKVKEYRPQLNVFSTMLTLMESAKTRDRALEAVHFFDTLPGSGTPGIEPITDRREAAVYLYAAAKHLLRRGDTGIGKTLETYAEHLAMDEARAESILQGRDMLFNATMSKSIREAAAEENIPLLQALSSVEAFISSQSQKKDSPQLPPK